MGKGELAAAANRLRRLLLGLGMAAAPGLALPACGCDPREDIILVARPDEKTAPLIDACREGKSKAACLPLCEHFYPGRSRASEFHCELHEDRDGYVVIHVANYWCGG